MPFDPTDASLLRSIGFTVGTEIAQRRTTLGNYALQYFLDRHGGWRVLCWANNVDCRGVASNPVTAYRKARHAFYSHVWGVDVVGKNLSYMDRIALIHLDRIALTRLERMDASQHTG